MTSEKMTFNGHNGDLLAARLLKPAPENTLYEPDTGYAVSAVFAHCFTCSQDILAARRICEQLAELGITVLSFDFTGLGHSAGEFSNTNFSSNVDDLILACQALADKHYSAQLLVGHSLGGAAVLSAAGSNKIANLKAVAVIGAPYDPAHVLDNFSTSLAAIKAQGQAEVSLGARKFTIKQSFIDDVSRNNLDHTLATMKKALLVMHSPIDSQVGVDNAAAIFQQAKHPKSFVSLDNANHLLTNASDAQYAATVIAAWVQRYLSVAVVDKQVAEGVEGAVTVTELDATGFKQSVSSGSHKLIADEPKSFGGTDLGMSPYQLLASGLGACTNMTIRMYARLKKLPLESVSVDISHDKVHAKDCENCDDKQRIDQFQRNITLTGNLDAKQRKKLLEIADKCPVHRTLENKVAIITELMP